jgi:hypothetical protein
VFAWQKDQWVERDVNEDDKPRLWAIELESWLDCQNVLH